MTETSVILAAFEEWALLLPLAFFAWGLIGLALIALGLHPEDPEGSDAAGSDGVPEVLEDDLAHLLEPIERPEIDP